VPDVAVMVTVLVPVGVPDDFVEELPPQPLAIAPTPSNNSIRPSKFGRRFRSLTKNTPKAKAIPPPANGHGLTFRLLAAAVVIVIVLLLAAEPLGVTDAGEKLHAAPLGRPEHANEVG
jgi:hypothetical protein